MTPIIFRWLLSTLEVGDPLVAINFLMLCVGRLFDLFSCNIEVPIVEHHIDGFAVVHI